MVENTSYNKSEIEIPDTESASKDWEIIISI
jgi:hypothetical protein